VSCCCPTPLSNGTPAGSSTGGTSRIVSVEYDFADQGTIVLADGPQLIVDTDGNAISVTVGNVAAAATYRFLQGTGLQFIANASNTVYNSATQSASFLEWTFANLFATYGIDSTYDILARIYLTTQTFTQNQVTGFLTLALRGVTGSPSNAANRQRGILRGQAVGAQIMAHSTDSSGGQNYVITALGPPNVYGIRHEQGAMAAFAGTWGGSFDDTQCTLDVGDQPATSPNTSGYRDTTMVLGLGFGTGGVTATMQVTVERMRLDFRATQAAA